MAKNEKSPKKRKQRSNSFRRLKELPCFQEMDMKIKAAISVEEVARWLQEDMLQVPEVQRKTLVRQLYRYKASLPPGDIVKAPPLYLKKAIEQLKRGVNELEELEHLYLFQLKRISIDAQTEEKINKLFAGTSREIQLAADLLVKILDKKMALGLIDKAPEQVSISGGITVNDGMDDATRTRLGIAAGKLVAELSRVYVDPKTEVSNDEIV